MKEKLATIIMYAVFFVIGWVALWFWTTYSFEQSEGNEMAPQFKKEKFKVVTIPERKTGTFKRGDIVLYEMQGVTKRKRTFFAARVIAFPGDRVEIREGVVHVNGEKLNESYVKQGSKSANNRPEIVIPKGYLYLLYDNRVETFKAPGGRGIHLDSRDLGPIGVNAIIGKL